MSDGRPIDWEIANLEGGLYADGALFIDAETLERIEQLDLDAAAPQPTSDASQSPPDAPLPVADALLFTSAAPPPISDAPLFTSAAPPPVSAAPPFPSAAPPPPVSNAPLFTSIAPPPIGDSLVPVAHPPVREAETVRPPPAPRLAWGPVLLCSLAAGMFVGALVAVATPRLRPRTPSLTAAAPAPAPRSQAAPPPEEAAQVSSVSEPARAEEPVLTSSPASSPAPDPTTTATREVTAPRPPRPPVRAASPAGPVVPAHAAPRPDKLAALAALPPDISRAEAAVILADAGKRAASCVEPGGGPTAMPVSVTFAPTGEVTNARLDGGPYVGTETGQCIARMLRASTAHAFDGTPIVVHGTLRMP